MSKMTGEEENTTSTFETDVAPRGGAEHVEQGGAEGDSVADLTEPRTAAPQLDRVLRMLGWARDKRAATRLKFCVVLGLCVGHCV